MVGGRIERIRAKVGDNVAKDQVIIEFADDNPGLQYQQAKTASKMQRRHIKG
jgi:multidrug efflux pump subunit AcrA (membrane-fusion protein)